MKSGLLLHSVFIARFSFTTQPATVRMLYFQYLQYCTFVYIYFVIYILYSHRYLQIKCFFFYSTRKPNKHVCHSYVDLEPWSFKHAVGRQAISARYGSFEHFKAFVYFRTSGPLAISSYCSTARAQNVFSVQPCT